MTRSVRVLTPGDLPPIVPMSGWTAPLTTMAALSMSFLAVCTLIAAMAAGTVARGWEGELAGLATVRVGGAPETQDAAVQQALEILRETPGILEARPLSDGEQAALLEPWLGDLSGLDELPAPRLIDLELAGRGPDREALVRQLAQSVPDAVYDDHAVWRGPLSDAISTLGGIAWAATALVALAAAGMVALAVRATLSAHLDIVRVVRLIGGQDRYIANAFVWRLAMRGLAGGMLGTGAALLALSALPSEAIPAALLPSLEGRIFIAIGVPLASALIAWLTARISVRVVLGQMI
ncbi:MAG: cell division protein FtsX [Pseudomonadota bacterium]